MRRDLKQKLHKKNNRKNLFTTVLILFAFLLFHNNQIFEVYIKDTNANQGLNS